MPDSRINGYTVSILQQAKYLRRVPRMNLHSTTLQYTATAFGIGGPIAYLGPAPGAGKLNPNPVGAILLLTAVWFIVIPGAVPTGHAPGNSARPNEPGVPGSLIDLPG